MEVLFETISSAKANQNLTVPLKASDTTENVQQKQLRYEKFDKAAVVSDSQQCSEIGKDILLKGGSAVDAAIGVFLCIGTVQFYYSGIGGGGFMLIYKRDEKKMYGLDYRESIPGKVTKKMFENEKNKVRGKKSQILSLKTEIPLEK